MKTRQQRLAEERAGRPPSPPQQLAATTRGPRRTRATRPSVGEATASSPAPVAESGLNPGYVAGQPGAVAAGSVAPVAQLAVPGESQALLRVWLDAGPEALASGRIFDDPNLELAIPSALVPELLAFIESRNRAEPQLQETSQMAAPTTPACTEPARTEPARNESVHTEPARIEPALQNPADPIQSPSLPLPKQLESQPAPLSPETLIAAEIPAIFRNKSHLPFYSADGTAYYGKRPTTAKAPGLNRSSEHHEASPQLDQNASAEEDSEMYDINENISAAGTMAETPLQKAMQSTQELNTETPLGSGWSLGNFFQSAHYSARRRFGFSPLSPVSERSEPSPQTQTVNTAQKQTETTARMQTETAAQLQTDTTTTMKPEGKRSRPVSAKATRARHRRHNDSVAESVKPITSGPNQRRQQLSARARGSRSSGHNDSVVEPVNIITVGPNHRNQQLRATKASGSTEAAATGEENSPAMRPTNRDQEEALKAQSGEPVMPATIRFPSRYLDRSKIAGKRKHCGSTDTIPNPDAESYGLGEAELYGNSKDDADDVREQQPGKLRRTSGPEIFSSQIFGDPHRARPYTGRMFKKSTTENNDDNVISGDEATHRAEGASVKVTDSGLQSLAKTPIPITNSSGRFKVPSPSDSDWSSSESEEGESSYPGPGGRPNFTAYEDWRKTASSAVIATVDRMRVDPTIAGNGFEEALENPGVAGPNLFNAYGEWRMTISPAVAAAIETMAISPKLAGDAFEGGLANFYASEW